MTARWDEAIDTLASRFPKAAGPPGAETLGILSVVELVMFSPAARARPTNAAIKAGMQAAQSG